MQLRINIVSIKDNFESHPVVWGLTLVCVGFISGFGVSETLNFKLIDTNRAGSQIECVVDGVESLSKAHHERVKALQQEILRLENHASDQSIINSYQREYKAAADRLREDVATEREALNSSLNNLELKCKKA